MFLVILSVIYEKDGDFMRFFDYSKLGKLQFDSTVIDHRYVIQRL